ncbi:Uncharacterised protein [Chlamydia abortus]|nr:Uncharacterised protein [Chlamydia abortus]
MKRLRADSYNIARAKITEFPVSMCFLSLKEVGQSGTPDILTSSRVGFTFDESLDCCDIGNHTPETVRYQRSVALCIVHSRNVP